MAELKPCPFCGGKNNVIMVKMPLYDEFSEFYVLCFVCGARTGLQISKQEAIEAWNRREEDGT